MSGTTTQLFIYGTLKRGDVRASLLHDQTFISQARTAPLYRLFNTSQYPALVEAKPLRLSGLSIHGELWRVDANCLTRLDEEEGIDDGLYARQEIVLLDEMITAQAYLYLHSIEDMPDCGESWQVKTQS